MTSDEAVAKLRGAGFHGEVSDLRLEQRGELWLGVLPSERAIAWFPTTESAIEVLHRERRVLELVAQHCSFEAPRPLVVDAAGQVDVRTSVEGLVDHRAAFDQLRSDSDLAVRFGSELGAILAELHQAVPVQSCVGWLPSRLEWPLSRTECVENVSVVCGDRELVRRADELLALYEQVPLSADDAALVHGDLSFHNLATDPATFEIRGLFDFKDAAVADRHLDFRYLIFDLGRFDLLDAACAAYCERTGIRIDRSRVVLYNAVWALSFLAFRVGIAPDEPWCGRTLKQDICWTRNAVAAVLGASARP